MRTVLLANGELGHRVARWLHERDELVGLVLHPVERQRGFDGLGLDVPVFTWPEGHGVVAALEPDALLSVLFGFRIPAEWLGLAGWRAINLHPGLLPHNAGANPNVWPIVDGSPAGTTLHVMTESIDEGAVLVQQEVEVRPEDTAATLYDRLMAASFDLLTSSWPHVQDLSEHPQADGGSMHRTSDLSLLDPRPDELEVIDRLRARTFPPYGAEYEVDGRRYRIRVDIEPLD